MKRYVTLPASNKRIPLGAYVRGVKAAIANPTMEFKHGLTTWWPVTGADIRRQFYDGLTERINAGISYSQRGVK